MKKDNTERFCLVGEAVPVEEPEQPIAEACADVIEPLPPLIGVVSNCKMLNIRNAPSKEGDIVAVVSEGLEIMVDRADFGDWYSVCLVSGVCGFCMKDFVTIQQ